MITAPRSAYKAMLIARAIPRSLALLLAFFCNTLLWACVEERGDRNGNRYREREYACCWIGV
jgi:hypothetical protein